MQWRSSTNGRAAVARRSPNWAAVARSSRSRSLPFPDGGDVIVYQAVLPEAGVYALKMSPYLPRNRTRDGHRVDDARELGNW